MLEPQLQLDAPPQQSISFIRYAQTFLHAHPAPDHQVRRVYRQGLVYILLIGTKEEFRNDLWISLTPCTPEDALAYHDDSVFNPLTSQSLLHDYLVSLGSICAIQQNLLASLEISLKSVAWSSMWIPVHQLYPEHGRLSSPSSRRRMASLEEAKIILLLTGASSGDLSH